MNIKLLDSNIENSQNLPWWAWTLIIVLSIIALVLGAWGMLSAFRKTPAQEKIDFYKENDFKIIAWQDVDKIDKDKKSYIIAFGIDHALARDEYFKPIYVFSTNNLKVDLIKFKDNFENNMLTEIKTFVEKNKVKENNLKFIILDECNQNQLDQKLKLWSEKFASIGKTFN